MPQTMAQRGAVAQPSILPLNQVGSWRPTTAPRLTEVRVKRVWLKRDPPSQRTRPTNAPATARMRAIELIWAGRRVNNCWIIDWASPVLSVARGWRLLRDGGENRRIWVRSSGGE